MTQKCPTCASCEKRAGFLTVIRFYCKRYKRNTNAANSCIDWRAKL